MIPKLRFSEFMNKEEWVEKHLGDISVNLDSKRVPITSTQREKGYVPYYGASGIIDYVKDYIFNETLLCISEDGANLIDRNYPIAFSISGKTWVNNHSHVLKFENFHTQIIVETYINSIKIEDFLTGMAQPKLNRAKLDIIPIPLPQNLEEQKKIASCLSSLDENISSNSQKLELLKDHKKGLMQNLFPQRGEKVPKYRFSEFEKDGDWTEEKLEKNIDLFSGIAFKSEEISDNASGVPILRGINITEGYIRHTKDIDKYYLGDIKKLDKYLVKENDIVIGMDGSKVGKNVALISKEDENSILIQRVARIRTTKNLDIKFIYQYFTSAKFRSYVDSVNTSSGIPHISAQQINDFKARFPPKLQEQQKIASCLFFLDNLITAQTDKIEQLKSHKHGLMQGLFPKTID